MATYYTSTTGNDGNPGTIGSPFRTIQHGALVLSAGDTLLVRGGTYDEDITSSGSGTGTSWDDAVVVRIANYPGETVWLTPSSDPNDAHAIIWFDGAYHFIEFDGINMDGTTAAIIDVSVSTNNGNDPHHIRIQNCEIIAGAFGSSAAVNFGEHTAIGATGSNQIINCVIHGGGLPGLCGFMCASYGVYLKGPNNLVDSCTIYDTCGAGIQIYNADGDSPDNNIIRNTIIHAISRAGSLDEVWGIIIADGIDNQIYNNLIYDITIGNVNSGNGGIVIGNGVNGTKVWDNTVYSVLNTGIYVGNGSGSFVQNNIVYLSSGSNYINTGSGTTHDHNLEGTDPLFVDAAGGNFQVQASSPAIGAGIGLTDVTTDITGAARPTVGATTIGAYEQPLTTITGTGAAAIHGPGTSGQGRSQSGTGAAAIHGPGTLGTGSVAVSGTGAAAVLGPTTSGTGTATVSGSGAAAILGPTTQGSGADITSGIGQAAILGPTTDGTGSVSAITGTGEAAIAGPTTDGTGATSPLGYFCQYLTC